MRTFFKTNEFACSSIGANHLQTRQRRDSAKCYHVPLEGKKIFGSVHMAILVSTGLNKLPAEVCE